MISNERSGELDAVNRRNGDTELRCLRGPRARAQEARDFTILMLRIAIAVDTDEVRFAATVVATDVEVWRVDLLTVLSARDVSRLCLVDDRKQLADDEQRDSECCGSYGSAAHPQTIPQMRLDCT
jgi:hypothetical protein